MKPQKPGAPKPESLDAPIKFAGKSWVVRFSTRAQARLKDHWNLHTDPPDAVPRLTGDAKLAERLGFVELEDMGVILWACFRSHHPEVTLEDCEEMVDEFGVYPLQAILEKVLAASMPPSEAGAKKKTTPVIR